MGQAQPLAGWCWVFLVVHAQMGPCSYIELRVWRCRTNRRTHHSDMPRTSGTYRNTWTDGFGCRHSMLAEYHHCQHLKMWNPSKRRRRRRLPCIQFSLRSLPYHKQYFSQLLCPPVSVSSLVKLQCVVYRQRIGCKTTVSIIFRIVKLAVVCKQ